MLLLGVSLTLDRLWGVDHNGQGPLQGVQLLQTQHVVFPKISTEISELKSGHTKIISPQVDLVHRSSNRD